LKDKFSELVSQPDFRGSGVVLWVMPVVALFFSKGLHHSFGREADLGWGLGGEGEAEGCMTKIFR